MLSTHSVTTSDLLATLNTLPPHYRQDEDGQDESIPVILHFGRDLNLLSTRSQVLKLTGVPVEQRQDLSQLDTLLDRHTHGLLVLCHSLHEAG